MNQPDSILPVLIGMSDECVMELHMVYCEGWPKFRLEIHRLKRDYIYDYLLMRVPMMFEMECDRMLAQLHIKRP